MYYSYAHLFSDFNKHNKWTKLIHWVYTTHCENKTKLVVSNWFFHVMIKFFKFIQVSRGEDKKRWHKERVVPQFAMQGGSTSNDRVDCNGRYQCKMVGEREDFIEGGNNARNFLWGWYIILWGFGGL